MNNYNYNSIFQAHGRRLRLVESEVRRARERSREVRLSDERPPVPGSREAERGRNNE